MAKSSRSKRRAAARPAVRASGSNRDKAVKELAVDALMALLAEKSFERIGLAEVAERGGLKLSELRAEFGSTLAMLGARTSARSTARCSMRGDLKMDGRPAARASVRSADAPARSAGALQRCGALADALGVAQS